MRKILLLVMFVLLISSFAYAENPVMIKSWDEFDNTEEVIKIQFASYKKLGSVLKVELWIDYENGEWEERFFSFVDEKTYGFRIHSKDVSSLLFTLINLEGDESILIEMFVGNFSIGTEGEKEIYLWFDVK